MFRKKLLTFIRPLEKKYIYIYGIYDPRGVRLLNRLYIYVYVYICVCICTHFDRKKKEFPRELKLIKVVVISR